MRSREHLAWARYAHFPDPLRFGKEHIGALSTSVHVKENTRTQRNGGIVSELSRAASCEFECFARRSEVALKCGRDYFASRLRCFAHLTQKTLRL